VLCAGGVDAKNRPALCTDRSLASPTPGNEGECCGGYGAAGEAAAGGIVRDAEKFAKAWATGIKSAGAAEEPLPTFAVDAARTPNIAQNIQRALDEGYPGVLNRTTNPLRIRANRQAACTGFCGPGSPDEYPFASSIQGGVGARVQGVPLAEQRIQGGMLARFYAQHGIGEGDPFRVIVTGLRR